MIKVETTHNLGQDFRTFDPDFPALTSRAGNFSFRSSNPKILSYQAAVTDETSIRTPGPMVEEMATFLR